MNLEKSTAIVTGAARGIGKSIAHAIAEAGPSTLVLVDVLAEELRQTADELGRGGVRVLPIECDISDSNAVDAMIRSVEEKSGPIDVLVNNAATLSVIAPVWESDPDKWFQDIRVNLYGSFLMTKAVVTAMVPRKRGYVINIVGGGVGDPHAFCTSYACSKTAIMRMTEGLAIEVKEHGIKVFAVAPPAVLTEMTRFIMNDPGGKKWRPRFPEQLEPGNAGSAEQVAAMVVHLLSGRADMLVGRLFSAREDFDAIVSRKEEILKGDLQTLRIR